MMIKRIKNYQGNCIIDQGKSYSFSDLSEQVDCYVRTLKKEIVLNDTVVLNVDYSFVSIALLLALTEFAVIVIPIVDSTKSGFKSKLSASSPKKVISIDSDGSLSVTAVEAGPLTDQDDYLEITSRGETGLVLFSSGTTGAPKVMVHSLSGMIDALRPPRKQRQLNFLVFLLFDHIGGLNTLLGCLNMGSTVVVPEDRRPDTVLRTIKKNHVNVLPTSPTFLNLMIMDEGFSKEDLSSLKLITYGTERMPESLLARINQELPGIKLLQTFGTSETGILRTSSKSSDSLFFKIDDPDREHKIIDGELYIKSRTGIKGYKNHDNSSFKEDGWFATGDLVDLDDEGFIKIVGRKNDIINVGGLKVLPSEVESVINTIDGVIDSTVYGQPNVITGNMVCCKIVTDSENDPKSLKRDIRNICRERLDNYKIPSKFIFDDTIEYSTRFKKL